jgi:hypothetical protein
MHVIPVPAFAGTGSGGNPFLNRLVSRLKEKQGNATEDTKKTILNARKNARHSRAGGNPAANMYPCALFVAND